MKKCFALLFIPVLSMIGCAKEAGGKLPPPSSESYTVVLDATTSGLTSADSAATYTVDLKAKEDANITYSVEIGGPCYIKTVDGYKEMILKEGCYFKSVSTYKVSRLILDIYEGQGINYGVWGSVEGSGTELERHASDITPIYAADSGAVYEYEVNSTGWKIARKDRKPGIYSVTIVFEVEK